MHDLGTISEAVKPHLHNFLAPLFGRDAPGGVGVSIAPMPGHFGETVRALREAAHLSQAELASKVGMHRNAISRLESLAEARMHPANYRALATAFGYEPGQLDFLWKHGDRLIGDDAAVAHERDVPAPKWLLDHFGIEDPDAYLALSPGRINRERHGVGDLGDRVLVSPRSPMNRSGLTGLVEIAVRPGLVQRYIGECHQEKFGICIRLRSGIEIRTPQSDIKLIHRVIATLCIARIPEPIDQKPLKLVLPPIVEPRQPRRRGSKSRTRKAM